MVIKGIVIFFCCMILFNMGNAFPAKKVKTSELVLIENEILQIAKENGLSKSDITIHWKRVISGGYKAVIKCHNRKKCKNSKIVISFKNIHERYSYRAYHSIAPLSPQDEIKKKMKPLFFTGNKGPGLSLSND